MKHTFAACLLSLSVAFAGAQHAFANQVTFFNTGVAADGSLLAAGSTDSHYNLLYAADGGSGAIAITPVSGWTTSPTAGYIGSNASGSQGAPGGYYIYEAVLDLTGYASNTASLSGTISSDDEVYIFLNRDGNNLLFAGGGFNSYSPFTINSGFVDGVNLVDFVVHNDGGPTGLSVDHAVATAQTPEPGSVYLLATGLLGSAAGLLKRSTQSRLG